MTTATAPAAPTVAAPTAATPTVAAPEPAAAAATGHGKSGMIWKIGICAFVLIVIGVECVLAVVFVSHAQEKVAESAASHAAAEQEAAIESLEDPAAIEEHATEGEHADEHGDEAHGAAEHGEAAHGKEGHKGEHGNQEKQGKSGKKKDPYFIPKGLPAEMEIDLGNFSLTATRGGQTVMINFHLWGGILAKDEEEFAEKYGANMQRIREKTIETMRAASPEDLNDPGLGLIKRQILAKTNHSLGKVLLQEVIFSDFVAIEP